LEIPIFKRKYLGLVKGHRFSRDDELNQINGALQAVEELDLLKGTGLSSLW